MLKDWKKVKDNKEFIEYEKKGSKKEWIQVSKGINYWYVSYPSRRIPLKTKSQALKYAKSYMRKH